MSQTSNRNQFLEILKHSPWYFLSSILTKLATFFLLPIYTKYLTPEEFGLLNTLESAANLLPLFISLSLDSAFIRYYFSNDKKSPHRLTELYSTLFWFILGWGIIIFCGALASAPITIQRFLTIPFTPYIPILLGNMLLTQLSVLSMGFLQCALRSRLRFLVTITQFVVNTSITILLLIQFDFGILANLTGKIFASAAVLLLNLYFAFKFKLLAFRFCKQTLKSCLLYSLPLLPSMASSWIANFSDRIILAYYGKISEVGLYSTSAYIARLLYFANDAITRVQQPISFEALTHHLENGKKQISEFVSVFTWLMLLAYLLLSLFSREILVMIADHSYWESYKIVGILAFIYVAGGLYRPFMNIISFYKKTYLISLSLILSALLNAGLNYLFIPIFGQLAAAISTLVTSTLFSVSIILCSQRLCFIQLNRRLIFSCYAISIFIISSYYLLDSFYDGSSLFFFAIKMTFILLYLITTLMLPFNNLLRQLFSASFKRLRQLILK